MAQSLAVRWRPKDFSEVSSQKSVIKVLERQLQTGDIKHCYLFVGRSGAGKTTIARILANKINSGVGEPIEIDAASNSGVENVRSIIKQAQERSIEGKYKIFIIDECHALSNQAWQAFLKCIEEPPAYTIFMFCTTDPQKIPATIINRVMKFNLTKIPTQDIVDRLKFICNSEKIEYSDESIEYIAKLSDGGMRDAIANVEKCADYGPLMIENVLDCLGAYSYDIYFNLVNAIIDGNDGKVLEIIEEVHSKGSDLKIFVEQFLNFCLDVTKYAIFKSCKLVKMPSSLEPQLQNATNFENAANCYTYIIDRLLDLKQLLKTDTNIKDTIEVHMLRTARFQ